MAANQTTTLTTQQFIQLEQQAGFPQSAWAQGLATAEAESSLMPGVVNTTSGATGLFQILPGHVGEPAITGPLTDPQTNVNDAFVLWKRAGGTFASDWAASATNSAQLLPSAQAEVAKYHPGAGGGAGFTITPAMVGIALLLLLVVLT